MARIKARAGFGEASDFEAVDIDVDFDELDHQYVPAVTREVPVYTTDPESGEDTTEQATDPETGAPLTKTEVVSVAYRQSDEQALRDLLVASLSIDEVEKKGVTNLTAEVSFTITGTFTFDMQDWGLDDDLDEVDPDEVDERYITDNFSDQLEEAAREAARSAYESEVEFDIDYVEAE